MTRRTASLTRRTRYVSFVYNFMIKITNKNALRELANLILFEPTWMP